MMMLGVVAAIPVAFGLLIWNSFRVQKRAQQDS